MEGIRTMGFYAAGGLLTLLRHVGRGVSTTRIFSLSQHRCVCSKAGVSSKKWCALNRTHSPTCGQGSEKAHKRLLSGSTDTGLFDCTEFSDPVGFVAETKKSVERSKQLVAAITAQASNPDSTIIDHMDQLSDELCRVADLSECIRQVHPVPEMASAAQEACLAINTFVEELNTNLGLYTSLRNLMDSDSYKTLDRVSKRTAEVFMHDFEISGIHLEDSVRRKAVKLHEDLLEVGYAFFLSTTQPTLVHRDECSPVLRNEFVEENKHVQVDYVPFSSSSRAVRKNAYLSYYTQDKRKTKIFEDMVSSRQKLAHLVGYPSFAHRVLKMSMARSPEVVGEFLERLSEKILPLAREDVKDLNGLQDKNRDIFMEDTGVCLWDVPLVVSKAKKLRLPRAMSSIRNWFSLESCIGGLDNLFRSLFGVRLEILPVKRGEVWHPSVYKFGFVDSNTGHLLGYTYGDLFHRDDKLASDCHFTIRGGRALEDGRYQLPIITLCCSIMQQSHESATLLSQHSVETLFHEMGHALHSMLGRAKYQNITGTRCSTDFAEVPSTLMEFFLSDERVLQSFARHYETGETLPVPLMRGFQLSGHFLAAYDTQIQICNAIVDQRFHAAVNTFPAESASWSADIYREVCERYSPLGYEPNTAYYLRFPHLCSYGGRYYSYLWSRAVASLIWNSTFSHDPFSGDAGERLRKMLSYGGGVAPMELVGEMLGFEPSVEQLVGALYEDVLRQRERVKAL